MSGIRQLNPNGASQVRQHATSRNSPLAATGDAARPDLATLAQQSIGKGDDQEAIAELRAKIESAAENAVKNAGSSDPAEIGKAVHSAIDQTLTDAGIDIEKLKSQLGELKGGSRPGGPPPGGPPPGGRPSAGGASDATSASQDLWDLLFGDSDETDSAEGSNTDSLSRFLNSKADGSTDLTDLFASLFKNFPNGSGIDVEA